jgi:adenylate cyclase
LRAVRAAVAMARAVERQGASVGETPLAVGLGLHYGDAVVGLVGHPTRQVNYTALGHTVVVAARLQTLASGGEVILSESVVAALPAGTVGGDAEEAVAVKGVAQPVPIYRLKSAEPTILPEG